LSISSVGRSFWGLLRAAVVVAVLVSGLGALSLREARAAFGERLLGFGGDLARLSGFRMASTPRRVSVNGVQLELVSASTPLSVKETLDRLEVICRKRGGVVGADQAAQLLLNPVAPPARGWLEPRMRKETESKGMLACLDTSGPLTLSDLTARLSSFVRTGDLSDVGGLRYAVAERQGSSTAVLFFWSEGAMPLKAMFPKSGDAPGADPAGVPRPRGARRLLSGIEHGAPFSFTAYTTDATSPESLVGWYQASLYEAGFAVTADSAGVLVARRGERTLFIDAIQTRRGVVASVSELR
jgi:hypothetical protein